MKALQLYRELLPDQIRVLGRDHPETLSNRYQIAFWTEKCGKPSEALGLYQKLLHDRGRVLGTNHPDTVDTRHHIQRLSTLDVPPRG